MRPQSQPESEATTSVTPSSQAIEMTVSSTSSSVMTSDCSSHEVGGSGSDRATIQAVETLQVGSKLTMPAMQIQPSGELV